MKITIELLTEWNACEPARLLFSARYPQGEHYAAVQSALREERCYSWSYWLAKAAWSATISAPESISDLVNEEINQALFETKDSPNISSGNYSTAASSGECSKAASSGVGTIAMVAGLGGAAKAGKDGCIALCWYDGNRNRVAVGYVGENDIEADTWYVIANGKLVKKS